MFSFKFEICTILIDGSFSKVLATCFANNTLRSGSLEDGGFEGGLYVLFLLPLPLYVYVLFA